MNKRDLSKHFETSLEIILLTVAIDARFGGPLSIARDSGKIRFPTISAETGRSANGGKVPQLGPKVRTQRVTGSGQGGITGLNDRFRELALRRGALLMATPPPPRLIALHPRMSVKSAEPSKGSPGFRNRS